MFQATISPRYFVKTVRNDYANWRVAWPREAGQNSLDAGATTIDIHVNKLEEDKCSVIWKDNGCGMDLDTMVDVFMSLGATTKDLDSGVGGFGIAAALLVMTHPKWELRSRGGTLSGSYHQYEKDPDTVESTGTVLMVKMEASSYLMSELIREWARCSSTECLIRLNGTEIATCGPSTPVAADLADWAKLSVLDAPGTGLMLIRVKGQYMYSRPAPDTMTGKTLILDVDSSDKFTSNRDRLQFQYSEPVWQLIEKLYRDPSAVVQLEKPDIQEFVGERGGLYFLREDPYARTEVLASEDVYGVAPLPCHPGHTYIVSNLIDRPVPVEFLPDTMSDRARLLLQRWVGAIQLVAPLAGFEGEITVGFEFSKDALASYTSTSYGKCSILVNPLNKAGRFRFDLRRRLSFYHLVMAVCHEVTHHFRRWHDEAWAAKFSDIVAKVMVAYPEFEKLRKAR